VNLKESIMTRPLALVLALLLAGCTASPRMSAPSRPASETPDANPEVHRGLLTNQKSSPDSGQSPGGDGLGGGRGL
jgi:starvation-inducible outer membrane lipoprotein